MDIYDIDKAKKYFSNFADKEFRENQAEIAEFAMNSNKNMIILECPTGFGKSLCAAICCVMSGTSTYLVHSKSLQLQIMEDFPEFRILMGRSNYPCLYNPDLTCADCSFINPSECTNKNSPDVCDMIVGEDNKPFECSRKESCRSYSPNCDYYRDCLYAVQKKKALISKLRVLNYTYFLLEANYVGGFSNNDLIVCDEADVLEKELLSMVQFSISENVIKKYNISPPRFKTATAKHGISSWKEWANKIYDKINREYSAKVLSNDISRKEDDYFKGILKKLTSFISTVDESWIYDIANQNSINPYHVFKPVWITSNMTNELLRKHGRKIILMSATFPDLGSISKTLGIPIKEIDYMEVPSNFKIENRPIYLCPVAKIDASSSEDAIETMINKVREIVDSHPTQKGLIHTSNYKLAHKIKEISPRMMIHNTANRLDVLEEFKDSDEPVILVSPSMERGVSLPDDMARFQIVAKCLAKGTKVVMYDGKLKSIEDIVIGDKVMGIDSTPRNVLNTITGYGNLYKIKQSRGASDYVVNEYHILSLQKRKCFVNGMYRKYPSGNVVYQDPYSSYDNIVNIPIQEYLLKSNGWKSAFMGYKIAIEYSYKNIDIDPYFLGLWLGDGESARVSITSYDKEIINYITNYSIRNNLKLRIKMGRQHEPKTYYLSNGRRGKNQYSLKISDGMYPILDIFQKYNLINNKHIPDEYLYNTSDIRLSLLAGLLDTDAYYNGRGNFTIGQKNKKLSEQIHYLCNSLGFRCSMKKFIGTIKSRGFSGEYYKLNISGNLSNIPTIIERKRARDSLKESSMHKISVEPFGIGDYYGITLDDDGLFLLKDFTVVHNCPFPDLNDKQISTRLYSSHAGKMWYKNLTAQTIEQMCGRANRHKDDSCEIYLLDEHIKDLIVKHPRMFSSYFKNCLIT